MSWAMFVLAVLAMFSIKGTGRFGSVVYVIVVLGLATLAAVLYAMERGWLQWY